MTNNKPNAAALFDKLLDQYKIKNHAELARRLETSQPQLCKMRHGALPLSSTTILAIHELLGMPVKEIRKWAAK